MNRILLKMCEIADFGLWHTFLLEHFYNFWEIAASCG